MSGIHLNDLSKIYSEQIVEKKDDTYLEPDMKKRQKNNEKARKELAKGPQMKNPHFEEVEVDEALDPVGKEDGDVDNDGDKDSSDKYLLKRRKAIGKAIKKKMSEGVRDMDPEKGTAERKARLEKKRGMKLDDHPQFKKEEFIPEVMSDDMDDKPIKEKKVKNVVKINPKLGESVEEIGGELIEAVEIFDILEEITDQELRFISDRMIDEIVEEFFLEAAEQEEDLEVLQQNLCESIDLSISLLLEQEDLDEVTSPAAVASARMRANRSSGSGGESSGPSRASVMDRVKSAVKKHGPTVKAGLKKAGKAAAKGAGYAAGAAVRGAKAAGREFSKGYERGRQGSSDSSSSSDSESSSAPKKKGPGLLGRIKSKLKKGIGMAARSVSRGARNVARKMDEAVYGGTKKPAPTDKRMLVTNADKKANTPAYQRMKAGDKRYKAADHMNEGDGDPCWDTHKQVGMKKKGGKMVPNCVPKEEVQSEEMSPQEVQMQKKKATLDKMIAMKRKQQLDKSKAEPTKAMGEAKELSVDDQMRISREANAKRKPYQSGDRQKQRAAQIKQMAKNAPKDTRTDAQKMTDATGPRPGSRYRGD